MPALQALGHEVAFEKGALSAPVLLRIDPQSGVIEAAGDVKAKRHAAAY